MQERLDRCETFESAIWRILDDAIALQGAEYGNVQLLVEPELTLVANRNLPLGFLVHFQRLKDGGTACARALRFGHPVVISDVNEDPEFAPFRAQAAQAGFRAVQSTPLTTPAGKRLGIVSTHFANEHRPTKIEMATLEAYGQIASQHAFDLLSGTPLAVMAEKMNTDMYRATGYNPSFAAG
jgi:GAF domain-containing protein